MAGDQGQAEDSRGACAHVLPGAASVVAALASTADNLDEEISEQFGGRRLRDNG